MTNGSMEAPPPTSTPRLRKGVQMECRPTAATSPKARSGSSCPTFAQNEPAHLEIDVIGHQRWWEVHYPDALVPSHSFVTANEIHIPTHTLVLLRLATRDVIHSLWIPRLHGKRDLIPGRNNKFSI